MEEKKIGKKRGPKGNWEELLEQYRKLPYSYQRVVTDVLKVMINESNKTFSKKKEIRKLYHNLIRQEMQKKNIRWATAPSMRWTGSASPSTKGTGCSSTGGAVPANPPS